jgi:signal transduction histidine kinase/ligand-binding sensor domain-containing protein
LTIARSLRCIAAACLLSFFQLALAAPAPLHPALLSDYTHDAWGSLQSAPVDIRKFAQDREGWLWLATATGLYRYDGVHFERTDTVFGHRLYSNNVVGLFAARDGALWVGYQMGGVTVYRRSGTRTYLEADGLPPGSVFHIEVAPDGTAWVATRGGLAFLAPGASRFERLGKDAGLPERSIYQILFARDGTQWIGSAGGAFFRRPGETRFSQAWPRTGLMALALGPDQAIWAVDTHDDYYRLQMARPAASRPPRPVLKGTGMSFDSAGTMWVMQRDGLERRLDPSGPGRLEQRLTRHLGLSGPMPQSFFEDREGNLWIGTTAGLDRLRRNRLQTLPSARQLENPGIAQGPRGELWVGSYDDDIRSYTAAGVKNVVLRGRMSASHRAADGTLWIGSDHGLTRIAADGGTGRFASPDEVRGLDVQALAQDGSGALWVSFVGGTVFRFTDGTWLRNGGLAGLPPSLVITIAVDDRGATWFGHIRNQVSVASGGVVRTLGAAEGFQLGTVLQLQPDGALMWVGGESGTGLFRAGRFTALQGRSGEKFLGVSGIVRLPSGDLWLHGADGIFRIGAASLREWLNGGARDVAFERFDARDGLQGRAPQFRPLPSALRAADGKLWFTTIGSVAILDPARIRHNPAPPPVVIRGVSAQGRTYSPAEGAPLVLPTGTDSVQVAFSVLSLSMPDRVRISYRLEGVDRGWQDAAGRREAYYTNLRPGTYRFQVRAANEDGVWNTQGAACEVRIPPAFVQTLWFKLLLVSLAAMALYALHAARIRYLRRNLQQRLQERMAERSRIARALHDTLLQSVQGLIMSFHAHVDLVAPGTRERTRLDQTLDLAEQLLVEGRDQIMGLRTAASANELGLALIELGKGLAAHGRHSFSECVQGRVRLLQPRVHDEVYAIAREALFNASRYAGAANITLELDYGTQVFAVRIRDDGRGLPDRVAKAERRDGHWGLVGMRERASCIGASLEIASQAGRGTLIPVTVAGAVAYAADGPALKAAGQVDSAAASADVTRM